MVHAIKKKQVVWLLIRRMNELTNPASADREKVRVGGRERRWKQKETGEEKREIEREALFI